MDTTYSQPLERTYSENPMYKKNQAGALHSTWDINVPFESPPPPPPPPPAVVAPPPPPPPPTLPSVQPTEWAAHNDEHGRTFYHNAATNETSWGEHDTSTWEQRFLPGNPSHSGMPYFFNRVTGRSVWQIPN